MAIHLVLGAGLIAGLALQPEHKFDESLKTFDVADQPPPPPALAQPASQPAKRQPAPAGKRADPSPIVTSPAPLPTSQPITAAPVAGTGSSSNAGAAAGGTGSGAGGSGRGQGQGGNGIGVEARLLSGNRSRLPRELLRPFTAGGGYAHLLLTVAESGRVTACLIIQGTGSAAVDDALCQVMIRQSRWTAARDTNGRPIPVQVRYTATWSKY